MQEILKEHYSYEESKNPYTIPLGKMNVYDEEKDFVWNLSLNDKEVYNPVSLLVGVSSDDDKLMFINNIINHVSANSDNIEFIFCDVNGDYAYLNDVDCCNRIGSNIDDIADKIETTCTFMMNSFKRMEEAQVNHISKLPNYTPKNIILCVSDMNSLMASDNYKAIHRIKTALGSIARLGKAVGINLLLLASRVSPGCFSGDFLNLIGFRLMLGNFDTGASSFVFEKDITYEIKPEIKGRGFAQSNFRDIYEVQLFGDGNEKV